MTIFECFIPLVEHIHQRMTRGPSFKDAKLMIIDLTVN